MNTLVIGISFLLDYYADMPSFFLANAICLYFYVINVAFGYPLALRAGQTLTAIALFMGYTNTLSQHVFFHQSQIWNLAINASVSFAIGFLVERYKRSNFVKREELLKARKEIEDLSNLKTKLISVLSHDLNTPINSLKGLLRLKEQKVLSEDELARYSLHVRKSLDSVSETLQNLVRWSRSQMEGFTPDMQEVNCKQVTDEVVDSLYDHAKSKQVAILNHVENTTLRTDPEILKLAIRNLLTNGIKFSHPNSELIIASKKSDGKCALSITDTGIGIPVTEIPKLFTLTKKSGLGTQRESGSGLGLLITKEFVELLGGTVSVHSEENKGTTFSIILPDT
jgi:signal transduction histidine kinase